MIFATTTLIILGCYTFVVVRSRSNTPEIIKSIFESGEIKLHLEDFPKGALGKLLSVEDPNFYGHNELGLSRLLTLLLNSFAHITFWTGLTAKLTGTQS